MLKVEKLKLPNTLPHPEAINAWRRNIHSYDPEMWELEYQSCKYLERVDDSKLDDRYLSIIKNMKAIINEERHIIPIPSFLSSWYWYRKEHQTRLEYSLRGRSLPILLPKDTINNLSTRAPVKPKFPNYCDVLFRYGTYKYMLDMLKFGKVRIPNALYYKQLEADKTRHDDETQKHFYSHGGHVKITTMDGKEMKVLGNLQRTVTYPNYFVLCLSCDWDEKLFADFNADACIIIKKPEVFENRIFQAFQKQNPEWNAQGFTVEYFDPYEKEPNQLEHAPMCKDFCFAYQKEFRYFWTHKKGENAEGVRNLEIGSLEDIAEIHKIN